MASQGDHRDCPCPSSVQQRGMDSLGRLLSFTWQEYAPSMYRGLRNTRDRPVGKDATDGATPLSLYLCKQGQGPQEQQVRETACMVHKSRLNFQEFYEPVVKHSHQWELNHINLELKKLY